MMNHGNSKRAYEKPIVNVIGDVGVVTLNQNEAGSGDVWDADPVIPTILES